MEENGGVVVVIENTWGFQERFPDGWCIMQMNDTDDFANALTRVEGKMGKDLLTDDDLIVLACREIARTYTRDEKNYT